MAVVERNILSAWDLCRSGGVHGGRNCGVGRWTRVGGGLLPPSTTPAESLVDYKRSFCCVVSRCLTRVERAEEQADGEREEKRGWCLGVGRSLIKFFTQKFVALVSLEFLVARLDEKSTKVASCFRRARHGIAL